jgi:hypothetical protein
VQEEGIVTGTTVTTVDDDAAAEQAFFVFPTTAPPEDSFTNGNSQHNSDVPDEMGGDSLELLIGTGGAQRAQQVNEALVGATFSSELTASNMFYWVVAARCMYLVAKLNLKAWSPAYEMSGKKLHLESYWLQLATHLPLLCLLTWIMLTVYDEDINVVAASLRTFSHVAMALLSIYAMEFFLRGSQMNWVMIAHRTVLMASMLYVIGSKDLGTMKDPLDLIMFGAIEAVGACIEFPAQVFMIYYRFWSDSSPEEHERIRPRVSLILQISLGLASLLKMAFVTTSSLWYFLMLNSLAGSCLIWIVPLIRIVQGPILLRSLYLQFQLYNQVSVTNPLAEKQASIVCPTETDDEFFIEFGTDFNGMIRETEHDV